ncbi:MAG: DNA translocase FtsK [Candidatus Harrisonbacteria bacterium]|nr:DNA translocase FtsK [Candidatus Harrisonbacteria bacterium]
MARKKKKSNKERSSMLSSISEDTKRSITGIIFLAIALILLLAGFEKAGPAGDFSFKILEGALGIGYYLLPLILFAVGTLFLISHEDKIFSVVFLGMFFFVISGLGLIDILFEGQAGLIGKGVGALEIPFGNGAAIILLITLLLTSLLITLNASIKIKWPSFQKELDEEDDGSPLISIPEEVQEEEIEEEEEEAEEEEIKVKKASEDEFAPAPLAAMSQDYTPPPLSLLRATSEKPTPGDLRANANIIKRTLESFGVPVEMGEINIGPKVTRYTLKPAEGVKITRITALNQDLALALAAHPIRIEAPIPGRSLVGIEVPNKSASIVRLGSLLSYPDFSGGSQLVVPLGRDVSGNPVFINVEKLPHLLVAGATGSGKSILLHSILVPLLYKNGPQSLKLILIDPKRVELTIYEGIPHLISPVITEGKKSIAVFRWAINEMERRYEILMNAGARDIGSYNKKNRKEALPYIMIVIDELADLMSAYGREVEGYVVRLAQMARATGIHLILATQRPSVEVVTGLIKANIPGRAALQVASQVDSRTILDTAGAEKLLGAGDLLFISQEYSKPLRVQGAFLTEKELKDVITFIKTENAELTDDVSSMPESEALGKAMKDEVGRQETLSKDVFDEFLGSNEEDDKIPEAIEIIKRAKKASASLLQRRLQVGYARAARLLDILEDKGLIGPADGAKPRELYMELDEDSREEEDEG